MEHPNPFAVLSATRAALRRLALFLATGLALFVPVALALPGKLGTEEYRIPGRGSLQLTVPVAWQVLYILREPEGPPTLRFSPLDGDAFQLFVTPYWHDGLDRDITSGDAVRALVTGVGQETLKLSRDQKLVIEPFSGAATPGYFFNLEDRDAPAEEFRFVTQGALVVGDVVLTFTLLTHERASGAYDAAFALLRGARLVTPTKGVSMTPDCPSCGGDVMDLAFRADSRHLAAIAVKAITAAPGL